MRVYIAPEEYIPQEGDLTCFLAGGITDCWDWQDAVIQELEKFDDLDRLVLFNPRRPNFPIHDPNAAQEQIEWEFNYLNSCDIFSMFFCSGESTQPICMYELGRHLARLENGSGCQTAVISVEEGYVRQQDVYIQTRLVFDRFFFGKDIGEHIQLILDAYDSLLV